MCGDFKGGRGGHFETCCVAWGQLIGGGCMYVVVADVSLQGLGTTMFQGCLLSFPVSMPGYHEQEYLFLDISSRSPQ